MVDVAAKPETHRMARATRRIRMLPATLALIAGGTPRRAT
jgi:cyclic pyranopterin phosphate synthase